MKLQSLTRAVATGTVALAAALVVPASLEAQSRLNFEGSARVSEAGPEGSQLFIDFLTAGSVQGPPTGTVAAIETINGAFDPEIAVGTQGIIKDLTVSSTGVVGAPIADFLTIGGYTFSLSSTAEGNTFGPISLFEIGGNTTAAFGVFGTVTGPDLLPPRLYQGVFTAQFAGQTAAEVFATIDQGGTLPVSFSAEFLVNEAQVVPEPATVVLLGTGVAALGLFGVRRRKALES